ncbi:MAG: MarR family transcriptional regulator [Candidatus Latescibacteria bacterium]|nr:MarR family transcriptional regulator [Candidatus Latescibacterota bacterium]
METVEVKAKELVGYIDLLIHRVMLIQHTGNDVCGHLTRQELNVITTLGKHGSCMMSEIADHVMLAVSSVTGIVDRLVEKKLVRRERSDDDRRIVRVELTPEGQEMSQAASELRMKLGRAMLNALDEHEQDVLLALFRKITHNITESEKHASVGT